MTKTAEEVRVGDTLAWMGRTLKVTGATWDMGGGDTVAEVKLTVLDDALESELVLGPFDTLEVVA